MPLSMLDVWDFPPRGREGGAVWDRLLGRYGVSSLVDKSLVVRDTAARTPCYRLRESMREFSYLRLMQERLAGHFGRGTPSILPCVVIRPRTRKTAGFGQLARVKKGPAERLKN